MIEDENIYAQPLEVRGEVSTVKMNTCWSLFTSDQKQFDSDWTIYQFIF